MKKTKTIDTNELFVTLGLEIEDKELQRLCLTHKSYLMSQPDENCNERLEFLGDSILGFIIAEYLYDKYQDKQEGYLSKLKSVIVSKPSLAQCAKNINLGQYIIINDGEETTNLRENNSVLSDAFEALIATIYKSNGITATRDFILKHLNDIINNSINLLITRDPKSLLQEIVQEETKQSPIYKITSETGEPHDMTFISTVSTTEKIIGQGKGKSKKEAEKKAAMDALTTWYPDNLI